MKRRSMFSKTLAAVLALVMLIGLMPVTAMAADDTGTDTGTGTSTGTTATTEDHLHLSKNAELQPDGTWTITLEAFATGTVKREVVTQVTPTDIILVLDQSGSMTEERYYIPIASGTYSAVSAGNLPTNEEMASGDTTYYFYDANDQKYYPITTTRQMVKHDSYWAYSTTVEGSHAAGELVCLESESDGKVATSWTYNNTTAEFDDGKGYLLSDYRLYLRTRTGNGNSRRYNYRLVQKGDSVTAELNSNAFTTGYQNANTAYQELAELFPNQQTDSTTRGSNVYALVYTPVELVNNDVYYYTYSYVDDQGQTWVIGHSQEDSGAGDNLADTVYDSTLGTIYTQNTTDGPRLTALKNAATTFVNDMQAAAAEHQVEHRIAVVGFSGNNGTGNSQDDYRYINSELFIGANQYNYWDAADNTDNNHAAMYYGQAFQSVNTAAGYNNLIASIGALEGEGPTYTSSGFNLAAGIASANAGDPNVYTNGTRKLVVVFMTDGDPGWNGYESTEANTTISLAENLETNYGATVYTVALLGSAPSDGGNVDNFLNNVTSDGITGTGNNKYTLATDGVSLTNFFHSIEIDVETSVSTVQLTENAFLVDRVSEYFSMPAGITIGTDGNMKDYISIYTADHLGNNEFSGWTPVDYEISPSADEEQKDKLVHAWLTTSDTDGQVHGVTVHNFDYLSSENMVTTEYLGFIDHNDNDDYDEPTEYTDKNNNGKYDLGDEVLNNSGDELITMEEAANQQDPHYTMLVSGKKLIVVIKGVTAKGDGAQDYYIGTNNVASGLWDVAEDGAYGQLEAFPMPYTMLVNRVYVLDYAKEACLDTLDNTRNALALDSAKDGVMNPVDISAESNKTLSTTDGTGAVKFGDAYIKTENSISKVYYTPKTTNWDGYDTFYVFWHAGNSYSEDGLTYSIGDPHTGYGWSKVNVMPANNVYYEDTFVTTSTDNTTSTGTVGIKFGDGWSFDTVGDNAGTNTEKPESAGQDSTFGTHGWVDSLADDTGFTDGTVAKGDGTNNAASATFTFTGTGVDIYSYTDDTTGTIVVKVEPVTIPAGYTVPTRYFIVDNYAASGDYYQIPTVSYTARGTKNAVTDDTGTVVTPAEEDVLVHGTYQVTIEVTNAAQKDGNRVTYYLDGIRVYNPLSFEHENDPTVSEGYGGEVHSFFYNIRDFLISENDFVANSENAGAVFIDQIKADQVTDGTETGEGVTTTTIGTYKDYGPKNEVYLAAGQMIVMKVDIAEGRRWFVSLKSPTGADTAAAVSHSDATKATINVNHTSDLYYEVVPVNVTEDGKYGYIAIENTGNALLAVTKYQITGLDPTPDVANSEGSESTGNENTQSDPGAVALAISDDEALTFAATYARMASVPYVGAGAEESNSGSDAETPDNIGSTDVEITNPDSGTDAETGTDTEETPSIEDQIREQIAKFVAQLFSSVRSWFNS